MKIYFIVLFVVLSFSGCVYEMDNYEGDQSPLIISGTITNVAGEHIVKIVRNRGYNVQPDYAAYSSSEVSIIDDLGNEERLSYLYYSSFVTSDTFKGEIGRSYFIRVKTPDGDIYESEPELMRAVAEIDSLYFDQVDTDIHFYIDYADPGEERNYYRWRYEGTYQRQAPLAGQLSSYGTYDLDRCYNVFWKNQVEFCWLTDYDNEFLLLGNDFLHDGNNVQGKKVYDVPISDKFNFGYCSQIKQQSLSDDAYRYLSSIQAQIGNTGSIFETSNYQITGNMKSVNNPDELVLGYFIVSAESSKRVFVEDWELYFPGKTCEENEAGCYPVTCVSCLAYGNNARAEQPDYWPDGKVFGGRSN